MPLNPELRIIWNKTAIVNSTVQLQKIRALIFLKETCNPYKYLMFSLVRFKFKIKSMKQLLFLFVFSICNTVFAQRSISDFTQFYPIGEEPSLRYLTSYTEQEKILFEANTIVRYSIYNDFIRGLSKELKHTQAWYVSFRPQIRTFNENSFPVKTPSYRIYLGTQHLFRLNGKSSSRNPQDFLGLSFETGHYSNGQIGCAFSGKFEDGSPACDSICSNLSSSDDLSTMLNRRTGNFSTNLSELIINYRRYSIDNKTEPYRMHSFSLGYILYHKRFLGIGSFGGFSDFDIKIYGRHRLLFSYEFMKVFKKGEGARISIRENMEIIVDAMQQVNPLRSETTLTIYPFINIRRFIIKPSAIGFFISYIYGHDNYNYRFLDSGHQASVGISWSLFPPFGMQVK